MRRDRISSSQHPPTLSSLQLATSKWIKDKVQKGKTGDCGFGLQFCTCGRLRASTALDGAHTGPQGGWHVRVGKATTDEGNPNWGRIRVWGDRGFGATATGGACGFGATAGPKPPSAMPHTFTE